MNDDGDWDAVFLNKDDSPRIVTNSHTLRFATSIVAIILLATLGPCHCRGHSKPMDENTSWMSRFSNKGLCKCRQIRRLARIRYESVLPLQELESPHSS